MPNNCTTLIQRKQQILHKILRSSSEGKLQNAVAETTSELRVAGTRKVAAYSSSTNHITAGTTGQTNVRRTNLFTTNRIQPAADRGYETHLPSIRDAAGAIERQRLLNEDGYSRSQPKTPLASTSPKSTGRPPSASISSLFHTLAKRSTENMMSSNGELDELNITPTYLSRRPSNESTKYGTGTNPTPTKTNLTPQKHSADSGLDSRYSLSPPELSQHRVPTLSTRFRPTAQANTPLGQETTTTTSTPKERTYNGQHYQRRANPQNKTPTKQKIDKYRRRSEEVTQAVNGNTLLNTVNAGLSATIPTLPIAVSNRSRAPPPSSTPIPVRRVTSDAEIQARLEVLRLSMETNPIQADQQNIRSHLKSPYLYSAHQQLAQQNTPHTPSAAYRRSQPMPTLTQQSHRQPSAANHHHHHHHHRRQHQQPPTSKTGQGSLYLAFIASRHLSSLEDTLFECDIDHGKILRIFSWLQNVEEHRHELLDHDKLLVEQNQRLINQEENLSLYSEIRYAVDDIPPNTSGKPCEKIAPMQFED